MKVKETEVWTFLLKLWSQFQIFESLLFELSQFVRHLRLTYTPTLNFLPGTYYLACQPLGTALRFTLPWFLLDFLTKENNTTKFLNSIGLISEDIFLECNSLIETYIH